MYDREKLYNLKLSVVIAACVALVWVITSCVERPRREVEIAIKNQQVSANAEPVATETAPIYKKIKQIKADTWIVRISNCYYLEYPVYGFATMGLVGYTHMADCPNHNLSFAVKQYNE